MADHSLPDDVSRWPADCFKLLGVSPTSDERELRRAYARLIRRFKPEHAPEQFRRIREAFEIARQQLAWNRFGLDPSPDVDSVMPVPPSPSDERFPPTISPSGRFLAAIEAAWKRAGTGDLHSAELQLRELQQDRPDDEELAVRRYWLLALSPEPSGRETPVNALRPCLLRRGVSGRLGELYKRWLQHDDFEAISDFAGEMVAHPGSQPSLAQLLRPRWKAAAGRADTGIIHGDLDRLQAPLMDDPGLWLELIGLALEMSIVISAPPAPTLVSRCRQELKTHASFALRHNWIFDRAEELQEIVQDLQDPTPGRLVWETADRTSAQSLADLARKFPAWSVIERRERLWEELERWAADPEDGLQRLDPFFRTFPTLAHSLLMALSQFGGWYQGLHGEELSAVLSEDISNKRRIRDLTDEPSYRTGFRRQLMRFCLEEFADVDEVIRTLDTLPFFGSQDNSLRRQLCNDLSMKTLVRGTLAFWAS